MSKDKEVRKEPEPTDTGGSAPMASKKTSVDLTPAAGVIKEKLQPIYGLRNILSGGLLLFELVDVGLRVGMIQAAHGEPVPVELMGLSSDKRSVREQAATGKRRAIEMVVRGMEADLLDPTGPASVGKYRPMDELSRLMAVKAVESMLTDIRRRKYATVAGEVVA